MWKYEEEKRRSPEKTTCHQEVESLQRSGRNGREWKMQNQMAYNYDMYGQAESNMSRHLQRFLRRGVEIGYNVQAGNAYITGMLAKIDEEHDEVVIQNVDNWSRTDRKLVLTSVFSVRRVYQYEHMFGCLDQVLAYAKRIGKIKGD